MVVINPCRNKVLSLGILKSTPLFTCLSQERKPTNPYVKRSYIFLVFITNNFSSPVWLISMPRSQRYLQEGHYRNIRIRKIYSTFLLLCTLKKPLSLCPEAATGGLPLKKALLTFFANFIGKPVLNSHFNTVAVLEAYRCSPGKFAKFLKTPILKNICERLFL